jgi:hypothetical protein
MYTAADRHGACPLFRRSNEKEIPFGSNAVRLSARDWLIALAVTCVLFFSIPLAWEQIEPFECGPDYRVPYRLSDDYWMIERFFRETTRQEKTLVIGDSVVWGHYVGRRQTLSHHLNHLTGSDRFANLGVDGIHPAALAGLIQHYGGAIQDRRVILNCNLLWMSSKRHDLQSEKEFAFNHPTLVPQLFPRIPCYREPLSSRLGIIVGREVSLLGWIDHLQIAYLDNTDLPMWTIEHPYDNSASAMSLRLPSPDEPPSPEPVAKPWFEKGIAPFNPRWVQLDASFQWSQFKRTIDLLRHRKNRVFVFVGPFNEHMLTPESAEVYQARKREAEAWCQQNSVPCAVTPVLPSEYYADASHPLSRGYLMLAGQLLENESFRRFLAPMVARKGERPP